MYYKFEGKIDPVTKIDNDYVLSCLAYSFLGKLTDDSKSKPSLHSVFTHWNVIKDIEKTYPDIVNNERWTVYETMKNYFYDYKFGWFFNSTMI